MLEQAGTPDAVTLRAVARSAGIAAPSIYRHFADRDALLTALVADAFADLVATVELVPPGAAPADRLRAVCGAYLRFGQEQPRRYAVLFSAVLPAQPAGQAGPGMAAFQHVVDAVQDCIDAGESCSADAFADANDLWVALHGLVTLRSGARAFPWPDLDVQLDRLVDRLARLHVTG